MYEYWEQQIIAFEELIAAAHSLVSVVSASSLGSG